ncbi:MAG: nickel/cobalt transporter [Xanthobacteraceae bacterium]|nr:nickel/cobalt transporter [Xanthobacteraceae bacterium]
MGRTDRNLLIFGVAVAAMVVAVGAVDAALAQGSPFGVGAPKSGPATPYTGFVGWIMQKQAEFYKSLSGAVRAAKTDGSALWVLFGLSFAYGVFHAAGPGHGKAVISSYVVANRETWWRGVVLSFASAMVQAAVAVAVVGIAAVLLNATAATMKTAVYWIEIVSYLLIMAIGLRLVWAKGRAAIATWRDIHKPKTVGAAATPAHLHDHHDHGHAHHDHAHHDHAHHDHAANAHHDHAHHDHAHCDHDHGSAWSHAHAPEPSELAGPGGWKRGLTAIFAVGLRPCSGAILVLVFTLAQGLFWAGVVATFVMGLGTAIMVAAIAVVSVLATHWAERFASTRGGYGMLFMRGIEVAAALAITAFGALLLMGYMASERLLA